MTVAAREERVFPDGRHELTEEADLALADSPLIFPATADYAKLNYYRDFANASEQQKYQQLFEPIVLS